MPESANYKKPVKKDRICHNLLLEEPERLPVARTSFPDVFLKGGHGFPNSQGLARTWGSSKALVERAYIHGSQLLPLLLLALAQLEKNNAKLGRQQSGSRLLLYFSFSISISSLFSSLPLSCKNNHRTNFPSRVVSTGTSQFQLNASEELSQARLTGRQIC